MTFSPQNTQGPFLPINQTFSQENSQFLIQITNRDRDIARYLNIREIAIYDVSENPTGEQWPGASTQAKIQAFRKIFFISDSNLNFAHGISFIKLCTHIYGTGTDGTNFYPIPYVDVTNVNNQIMITATQTNVVITKGGGSPPAITNGIAVLEYLKN
jgi:hypothetical protein